MITLDPNHFGFQRAGRPERRKKSKGDGKGSEESSQSRANLNGGELDKEPFLRDKRGQATMTLQKRKTKDDAQHPDRPKWRRAGARAGQGED